MDQSPRHTALFDLLWQSTLAELAVSDEDMGRDGSIDAVTAQRLLLQAQRSWQRPPE